MNKFLSTISLAVVLCSLTLSCTKDFEKINTDPNKILFGQAAATSLYEPLVYGIGTNHQSQTVSFANELVQVTAFTGGSTSQIHQYQITNGNWQSQWDFFARYGFDAHHMIDQAIKQNDKYSEALGLIWKVYLLSTLSAVYGDIPYSEAYMQTANTAPVFDSQERLAEEFIADLDSAATILKRRPTVLKPGNDRMYGNNFKRWIKFANSLKMRILCRMSGIDDKYWNAIQDIVNNPELYPVFEDNEDNAKIQFEDMDPYRSHWKQENTTESSFCNHRITETMINMMVEFSPTGLAILEDPRIPIYATQKGGVWKGSRGGIPTSDYKEYDSGAAVVNYSVLTNSGVPAFIMDYSEVLFILAEGVQKGKLTVPNQTAKNLYESAVKASIAKWAEYGQYASKPVTVRSADITALLASKLASYDMATSSTHAETDLYTSGEELIACQKFISLYFCGYEVYNEWRRTEYPNFEIADGTESNDYELPTRFGYPNYTVASNSAHVAEAIARMGGAANNMHVPMDWSWVKLKGAHRRPHPRQK